MNNDSSSNLGSRSAALWTEIGRETLGGWNLKLAPTECDYQQFPFWAEAQRRSGFRPRFFYYGAAESPTAFVSITEAAAFPFRFALIDRGPYFFDGAAADAEVCIADLISLCQRLGYAFVRFTRGQRQIFSAVANAAGAISAEPFPFCRDSRNALIVDLKKDADAMLAGFNATARRKIRKAVAEPYEIRIADSDADFESAWRLLEMLAAKKHFQLSARPKSVWSAALKYGADNRFARLYLCSIDGRLVAAQITIRGGSSCEATLSALDTDALDGRPSPAALLMWTAMRDAADAGCRYFNLGGPGDARRNNHVSEFKNMFRPTLDVAPEPVCVVIKPTAYRVWNGVYLRAWRGFRGRVGRFTRKIKRAPGTKSPPAAISATAGEIKPRPQITKA